MSITQGYIVGRPLATVLEPRTDSAPASAVEHADRPLIAEKPVLRAGIDGSLSLSLPAFAARRTAAGWVRDYLTGLRILARSLPRFASLTVTFRSDLSFFDQVAPVLLLARFFGVRTVLRYRSNKAETELDDYGRALLPFLRLCDRIEVSNRYLAAVFSQHGLAAIVRPDSVDSTQFRCRAITSVQPHIIMTRRLARGNGLTGALKAFQLVKVKYPRAEMTVVGDGPLRSWLEEFVRTERIYGVTFSGRVDHGEVARLMGTADIYVNNATIDALPTSLLEALMSGLCVISTAVGDIPKLIQNGRNGLLVAPNDFAGLADRIVELIETPPLCTHLSQRGQRSVMGRVPGCPEPDTANGVKKA